MTAGAEVQDIGVSAPARPKTKTCVSHCRTCGACFGGDTAFDHHRVGPPGARHCENPLTMKDKSGELWYEAVEGDCRISKPSVPRIGVEIWRRAGAAERFADGALAA